MATGKNQLLTALADLTARRLGRKGILLSSELELLLGKLRDGDEESLGKLPEALIEAGRSHLHSLEFFARDPVLVAEALCGSSLTYAKDASTAWSGLVTQTGAYRTFGKKDESTANAIPGTIGLYPAQGHDILIISAHERGKAGTVALWGLGIGENLSMSKVTELMTAEAYTGKIIGVDCPFYIQPRNPGSIKVGNLEVTSIGQGKGAEARYKLARE